MHNPNASTWAAILSAAFAFLSYLVARDARQSADKSVEIEKDRRHTELEPTFDVYIIKRQGYEVYEFTVKLEAPMALEFLDEIVVEIQDARRKPVDPLSGVVPEDLQQQLWSKYRFSQRVDNASADGKRNSFRDLYVTEKVQFQLDDNPRPTNYAEERWRHDVLNSNFKFVIYAKKSGFKDWRIPITYVSVSGPAREL